MKRKIFKISYLAEILSGELKGDPEIEVSNISDIREASENSLSFISNPKYEKFLKESHAGVIVLKAGSPVIPGKNLIFVEDPYKSVGILLNLFNDREISFSGISDRSFVSGSAYVEDGVKIGPMAFIGNNSRIGKNTVIFPGVSIGDGSIIGSDCIIYSNVSIYDHIEIGNRVIIHSGTVIGSDGFGFVTDQGVNLKIPQIGNVIIEDDVEIGANVTIDRATFGATRIKKGVKIDNLVQIAHNVEVGENSLLVAQAGIAGSSKIGSNVTIAAKAGISGHIEIGNNAKVGAKSGVMKSIPEGVIVSGFPARPLNEELRVKASLRNLPAVFEKLNEIEKRLSQLEEKEE
ncbi:MAG: UDP-3-O-(3-hydroxymyristoyl)glucosamine N-acyltransferase [bacterium]|nr:UDP-3-O-(3-hydroxymyristoyl)glucosamine N-acyltransferase [bacterium]